MSHIQSGGEGGAAGDPAKDAFFLKDSLTNKLLVKFFSDSSNWTLLNGDSLEKKNQGKETLKKSLSANIQ